MRLVKAFVMGSTATTVGWLGAVGLLLYQARQAQRSIPLAFAPPPPSDGLYGHRNRRRRSTAPVAGKDVLKVAILGDSLAAGLGATKPTQTPGGLIAKYTSRILGVQVRVDRFALVSARSPELSLQVHAARKVRPDLAVIIIGGNDVTHNVHSRVSTKHLLDAVATLRAEGIRVIVGTCPDLSKILSIPFPLKWLAKERSNRLAEAQRKVVEAGGGTVVPLSALLDSKFTSNLNKLLSSDRFHPSPDGYELLIQMILPTILRELREVMAG